jgi:hypothetical protein
MMETITLEHGGKLSVHLREDCEGDVCPIHKRTNHHMRDFPQLWRWDRGIMERTCPHGVGHPDPDDVLNEDKVHGCDGCCSIIEKEI